MTPKIGPPTQARILAQAEDGHVNTHSVTKIFLGSFDFESHPCSDFVTYSTLAFRKSAQCLVRFVSALFALGTHTSDVFMSSVTSFLVNSITIWLLILSQVDSELDWVGLMISISLSIHPSFFNFFRSIYISRVKTCISHISTWWASLRGYAHVS